MLAGKAALAQDIAVLAAAVLFMVTAMVVLASDLQWAGLSCSASQKAP